MPNTPAFIALDGSLIAEIVRFAAVEIKTHEVRNDVLPARNRSEIPDIRAIQRIQNCRACRFLVAGGQHSLQFLQLPHVDRRWRGSKRNYSGAPIPVVGICAVTVIPDPGFKLGHFLANGLAS